MTVLDAGVVIAALSSDDPLHARAVALLGKHPEEVLLIHAVTRADSLVAPARSGRLEVAVRQLADLEVETMDLTLEDSTRLALIKAETGVKLPDCCVLLAATARAPTVATFDERLARAAERLGLDVLT